jgi:integrase/recombinase XerD
MDLVPLKKHSLTRAQCEQLADVPPEEEWLANITNLKTRRAYKEDVREFIAFTGLQDYMGLRSVGRSHVIAWRKEMERRGLASSTVRRKLSALSSLFDYLCERNAVTGNPVDGVKRPMANGNEGSTPALGDAQARKLLEAPLAGTLKGVRDRAILATLLYHGIRREELCGLRVKDLHSRQGVMHFRVKGKRAKIRFVPVNAAAQRMIEDYLALTGHRNDIEGALFRPVNKTIGPVALIGTWIRPRSIKMLFESTVWKPASAPTLWAYVYIRCVPRQQQTLYRIIPILPRFRSGWCQDRPLLNGRQVRSKSSLTTTSRHQ